jgi:hypothetical protein
MQGRMGKKGRGYSEFQEIKDPFNHFAAHGGDLVYIVSFVSLVQGTKETRPPEDRIQTRPSGIFAIAWRALDQVGESRKTRR